MYGLGRGFGDTVVTDPVTGAVKVVTSSPITTDTVSSSGVNVYTDSSGNVVTAPTAPQTLTEWLNANSTTVIIGAVAFIALFAFAKAGR